MGVGFQFCQPQNVISLLHGKHLFSCLMLHTCTLEDDHDLVEKKVGKVTTLNELAHNLMSAFILGIHFILLLFKATHPVFHVTFWLSG
jgi:hypothetical protein